MQFLFLNLDKKKNYEIEYYETSFDPNVIEDYISKYNLNTYYIRPYEPAFFINIASIFKLSPKISFFIDLNNSLAVVSKPKELIEGKSLNSSYYGNYSLKDEDIEKEYRFVCLVQPGMRYKYKENAVFQFTASVLNVSDELIPIPQISWIFSLK